MNGIEMAVKKMGGQGKLAKAINEDRQMVSYWVKAGYPSPLVCIKIHEATGVPYHKLHPLVYPAPK